MSKPPIKPQRKKRNKPKRKPWRYPVPKFIPNTQGFVCQSPTHGGPSLETWLKWLAMGEDQL